MNFIPIIVSDSLNSLDDAKLLINSIHRCLSKYLGFLNDTAYPISSDSGERVISDVISAHCVHWTNGRPMQMDCPWNVQ